MSDLSIEQRGGRGWSLPSWLKSVWMLVIALPIAIAIVDPDKLTSILTIAITALGGTLPYIAIAVLLIAYLKASGAERVIARAFEGRESRMIVMAALFGGLAPFCSCEVIPFVAGLLAVGVPLAAVMAFWLSSPLVDPPQLFITAAAIDWNFAIGKAAAAVAIGLIGGFSVKLLASTPIFADPLKPRSGGGCCSKASPFKGQAVWRFWQEPERVVTFRNELVENGLFLLKWLSLAYILEALLITYVPADAIATVVGGTGILPIITGALVGMPAYLNGYAAPPLVAGLMEQGMSTGAAMAFMVAGSVSSIPAMAAVYSLVKLRVFAAYVALGLTGAVLSGIVYGAIAAS